MDRQVFVTLCLLLAIGGIGGCGRRDSSSSAGRTSAFISADDIFSGSTVLHIDIEIPKAGMRTLRRTHWGEGDVRPETRATVKEGATVYKNVAIHLKGAAGSFRSVDDRPGLTLNFDKFERGQSFHGLHKISLNNSVQDPSYLSEKICRELFVAAGVPIPRAGHALVKLNGRDLGFYVLLEGANKQFLKRHFKSAKGNLYDGGFVRDVHASLAVNCGENPANRSGLDALLAAERASRQSKTLGPLESALDVDRFLSMVAMEVIVRHWDGYALNKNNWRLFHDLDSNKMVFIPHGVDQTFGIGEHQRIPALWVTEPAHWQGRMAVAVMRTPEGQRRYRERVRQVYTNVFQTDRIVARIDEVQARVGPVLAEWDRSTAKAQEREAASFKRRILRRGEELRRQTQVKMPQISGESVAREGLGRSSSNSP